MWGEVAGGWETLGPGLRGRRPADSERARASRLRIGPSARLMARVPGRRSGAIVRAGPHLHAQNVRRQPPRGAARVQGGLPAAAATRREPAFPGRAGRESGRERWLVVVCILRGELLLKVRAYWSSTRALPQIIRSTRLYTAGVFGNQDGMSSICWRACGDAHTRPSCPAARWARSLCCAKSLSR